MVGTCLSVLLLKVFIKGINMTPDFVLAIGKETVKMVLLMAAPMLGAGMLVGLIIAILQAATQIQEMTLTFVPKIIAVLLALLFFLPWMLRIMVEYTTQLITNIPNVIG
jgi:flagellar biosynthetic protein FliQ